MHHPRPSPISRIAGRLDRIARRWRVRRSFRHLYGPESTSAGSGDVTVVTLVRDGAYYLGPFLDHYRAIGARHFVFVDNGSTDETLALLRDQLDVTVVQSLLPWGQYENEFRQYAARRFCTGSWCLFADMDEIFDFEGSNRGLPRLAGYLAAHGYTALIAQMLEMFPTVPIRETAARPYGRVLDTFTHYDLSNIVELPYDDTETIDFAWFLRDNSLADDRIRVMFGGVRRRFFNEMCCLTKHPLVFVGPQVAPGVHPHCSERVACADVTALIRHYKFANDPVGRDSRTVREAAIGHGEDRLRLDRLSREPGLSLMSPQAQTYAGLDPLYEAGFLIRSDRYSEWMAGRDDG